MQRIIGYVVTASVVLLASACSRADFPIVEDGRARAVIVLGTNASETERHAAEELSGYVEKMTRARLTIASAADLPQDPSLGLMAIGGPGTNGLVGQLVDDGRVRLSVDDPGLDGYIIQTTEGDSGRQVLVLGGSRDRGTLYAVYDLLASYGKVGFFWDAERIPRVESFVLPPLSVSERPFFRDRLTLGHCSVYTLTLGKSFEDWRRVIDWSAKNRFNQVLLYGTWPPTPKMLWNRVRARMGIEPEPEPTEEEKAEAKLYRDILRHIRRLDLDALPHVLPGTLVDDAFRKAFPQARYFKASWSNVRDPDYHVFPGDPAYRRLVRTCVEVWREMYPESGRQYFGAGAYPEQNFVQVSREEIDEILTVFPTAVEEALREADPQGIWQNSGWNFTDSSTWPEDVMRRFFANIRGTNLAIWDLACDEHPIYASKRGNYWYGKPWLFGIIHSYGGNDHLHGDIADVLKRARQLIDDPKARNCVGFAMTTEIMGYCMLYYDFLCRVGWDPRGLTVGEYLEDFAVRRYGREAAPRLLPHLRRLVETVYGPSGGSVALYQTRPHLRELHGFLGGVLSPRESMDVAASLEAMVMALLREDALRGETVYLNDVVDYSRQYLTEIFDSHRVMLDRAFQEGNREAFEREVQILGSVLDHIERIVSTRWDYRFADVYRRQAAGPLGDHDGGYKLRDELSTFAVCVPKIIDYASNDMYELVRSYYRPRMDVYTRFLRERMDKGERSAPSQELDRLYRPIEIRWVEAGFDPEEAAAPAGSTVDLCRKALDETASALAAIPDAATSLLPPKGLEGLQNIGAGCCTEASSVYGPAYSVRSVADGDVLWGQGWASGSGEVENQWLLFDFGDVRTVAAVQYFIEPIPAGAEGKRYCRSYRVEISDDGKAWRAVAAGDFPPGVTQPGESLPLIEIEPSAKGRYLKFNMVDSYCKDVVCVGELAVWGH